MGCSAHGASLGFAAVVSDDSQRPFDLERIVGALEQHGVRYVLIGGISGLLHGMVRCQTRDVDLLVHDQTENRVRLAAALTELHAVPAGTDDRRMITGDDLVAGNTQWDTDSGPVDVLMSVLGPRDTVLFYDDIARRAEFFVLVEGQRVPAASLDDVIRMKEAADRHKDHQALPELRRLRGDQEPETPTGHDPFAGFDIEDGAD
jgi:predicted nucleotidyltransferase